MDNTEMKETMSMPDKIKFLNEKVNFLTEKIEFLKRKTIGTKICYCYDCACQLTENELCDYIDYCSRPNSFVLTAMCLWKVCKDCYKKRNLVFEEQMACWKGTCKKSGHCYANPEAIKNEYWPKIFVHNITNILYFDSENLQPSGKLVDKPESKVFVQCTMCNEKREEKLEPYEYNDFQTVLQYLDDKKNYCERCKRILKIINMHITDRLDSASCETRLRFRK